MDLGIKGKKALVTASGRGIGRAIAIALANEGVSVAVVSRTEKDIESLLNKLEGQEHAGYVMDLCEEGRPKELLEQMRTSFGEPDIVVHNLGGTLNHKDPFCDVSFWRKLYRFNLEVAIEMNNIVLPKMQAKGWGRVIHISSIAGMENHGTVPYCSMKAALTAYTRSIGGVVAPNGVVVSAVLPGAVVTQGGYWEGQLKNNPQHAQKFILERQRIGRFGEPEEIANFVCFLSSELATFNCGGIIPIDGGQGRGYFGQ